MKNHYYSYKPISNLYSLMLLCCLVLLNLSGCAAITTGGVKSSKAASYNAELGIKYLQAGRLNLANEKLSKALEQNPGSATAHHYYAILQQRLGNEAKAETHFKQALRFTPKDAALRNNYGSYLCKTNRLQPALQQFLLAVKDPLYKTPEYAYTNAGICARKSEKDGQAETYFRQALKKNAGFPSALYEMAKLSFDRQDYARAQAFMLRYEQVGQSTPEALLLCSQVHKRLGNLKKSNACSAALIRLFPNSEESTRLSRTL